MVGLSSPQAIYWKTPIELQRKYNFNWIEYFARELVSVLVEYGGDVQRKDEHGKTVSDYAADNKNGVSTASLFE